jgi:POT family proton-dependent oligopeptide transporter
MMLVMMVVLVWFLWFILSECTEVQRQQMIALMSMIFMCLVFFTLYEQTYGSWVTFTDRLLTKDIAPSLVIRDGTPLPWSIISLLLAPASFVLASWLSDKNPQSNLPKQLFAGSFLLMLIFLVRDSLVLPQTGGSLTYLGALFLVLLAPIFSALWAWLEKRKANPSKPVKSSLGLIFGGLSFIPMALAAQQAGETGLQASVWWLVLSYFILEVGEMCISPVGLSAVTQLSVPRVMSMMMGTWFLATAFSETLAAMFGKLAAIDIADGGTLAEHSVAWTAAAAKYESLFWKLMWLGLAFGVLAFLFSPLIKRAMHGVK